MYTRISISIFRTEKQIKFEETNDFYYLFFSANNIEIEIDFKDPR